MEHKMQNWYECVPGTGLFTRLWHPRSQSEIERCRFSYKQLSLATGGFSKESQIGQPGGSGTVYRGVLPGSEIPVAVKILHRYRLDHDASRSKHRHRQEEFTAEVSIMRQLRHRNLVQLLGWCKDRDKYYVVYELMANGSLDQVLYGLDEEHVLSWPQRFNIVRDTAAALDYLHQGCRQQVIHRDVKSGNILLDDEWNAKLGCFWRASLLDHQTTALSPEGTAIAGTLGYMAPEVIQIGEFTEKTDVYSFGTVALEIACGRNAFSMNGPRDETVLVDWVWERWNRGDLLSVVDRRLGDYDTHWMNVVLLMGLVCCHPNPVARPTMRHVVQVLAGDVPVPRVPTSKPPPRLDFITRIHSGNDSSNSTD